MVNHQTLSAEKHAATIKRIAKQLGFAFCGISKAAFLEEEAPRLEQWIATAKHGEMAYMANHFDKRLDPRLLVPGAKSVVSLLYNYYPTQRLPEGDDDIKISKYAYGRDYHLVIKDKLFEMVSMIREEIGDVNGRVFVDSAPVMDKVWAAKSGLGWVGKNTNLIVKGEGSFFFIAELVIDLALADDGPIKDYCGSCTRCIDDCPTEAISQPYVVDGSKCISYLTIELKSAMPDEWADSLKGWAFGCDICQDVCPWNRFSKPHNEPQFTLTGALSDLISQHEGLAQSEAFARIFKESPLSRPGLVKMTHNLKMARRSITPQNGS